MSSTTNSAHPLPSLPSLEASGKLLTPHCRPTLEVPELQTPFCPKRHGETQETTITSRSRQARLTTSALVTDSTPPLPLQPTQELSRTETQQTYLSRWTVPLPASLASAPSPAQPSPPCSDEDADSNFKTSLITLRNLNLTKIHVCLAAPNESILHKINFISSIFPAICYRK